VLLQDVKYALRSLWLAKGFAVVAILCLGFGIGLNSTIFSIVDGVLLKPYPYADPDRLVYLASENRTSGADRAGVSFRDLDDLRASARSFATVTGLQFRSLSVSDSGGEPSRYQGQLITWDLFPMLGIQPILGRAFTASDDQPGAAAVALISHAVWTLRYHNDGNVIGRQILVNGNPTVIVGVMPARFEFPENAKLWLPITPLLTPQPARDARSLNVFARLAPGVTIDAAQSEAINLAQTLAREYPDTNRDWSFRLYTLRDEFVPPDVSQIIWIMMAAVTLVLFIACSNVANLQLARATSRRRELSVRTALGAGRGRILRQLLTENVVLALISVPFGLALAVMGSRLIFDAMPPDQVPYYITWSVDARTTIYAIAVAAFTAVLFGILPALQVTRGSLVETLKEGTRGNSVRRSYLRSSLVVAQISLALVSLVGALLFVRTFVNLDSYAIGFDPRPIMTMRVFMAGEAYNPPGARGRRVRDVLDRIHQLPGVQAAFASNMIPLDGGGGGGNVIVDGRPVDRGQEPYIDFHGVTPGFAKTLAVAVRGRDFTEAEGWAPSGYALINEKMARDLWPDTDAIGRRFRLVNSEHWFFVIGVIPDIQTRSVDPSGEPTPTAFVPYAAYQETANTGFTIRVAGVPTGIASPAREVIRASDGSLPVYDVLTMDDLRRLGFWQYQLFGWIFGAIGVVGLLLAAIGVYGVLSYGVSQRTQEIGVRVALGAGRRQVLALIVGHGLVLAGIGILVGLVLSIFLTPTAQAFFYQVSPWDPTTLVSVSLFLAAVALVASYLPARRATAVNPIIALRGDT
jgi:predicted permease